MLSRQKIVAPACIEVAPRSSSARSDCSTTGSIGLLDDSPPSASTAMKVAESVCRRSLVSALCVAISPLSRPQPSTAVAVPEDRLSRLAAAVRGNGDAGLSAWGESWSSSCSWSASPVPLSTAATPLPSWLEGRWRVTSNIDGVTFPIGRKFITEALPGVRMASILPLPNIGATPKYELTYGSTVDEQRAANAASTLQAFWPKATVLEATSPRAGSTKIRYSSPTKSMPSVNQSTVIQLCSSEGGSIPATGEYIVAEVFQQDNLDQATRGEYLVLTSFAKQGDASAEQPSAVRVRQRVAAFLQPTDGAYFDAQGKPVAFYDYSYQYERL